MAAEADCKKHLLLASFVLLVSNAPMVFKKITKCAFGAKSFSYRCSLHTICRSSIFETVYSSEAMIMLWTTMRARPYFCSHKPHLPTLFLFFFFSASIRCSFCYAFEEHLRPFQNRFQVHLNKRQTQNVRALSDSSKKNLSKI